jgi:hypothetical protein
MIKTLTLLVINSLFLFWASLYYLFIYANWGGFTKFVLGSLFFADAVFYLLVVWGIWQKSKLLYYFGLFLVLGNIVLVICDQFGWVDFSVLVLNLATLVSLVLLGRKSKFFKR